MRTIILFISLFFFNLENSFSRGVFSSYSVNIKMRDSKGNLLKNKKIYINNKDSVLTDSLGICRLNIFWMTIDVPKGTSKKKLYKQINPEYIMVRYQNQYFFFKNKWKKFGLRRMYKSRVKILNLEVKWE